MINIKHTKRFVLIFNLVESEEKCRHIISRSFTEFDNESEYKEEIKLIKELYNLELLEKRVGYVVLDYKDCKIIKPTGCYIYLDPIRIRPNVSTKSIEYWIWQDLLFRNPDEIPRDYSWDNGEYEGWLKYRWGDGSNAIDAKTTKKNNKKVLPSLIIEKEDLI